jgi:hypothetical protein
MNNAIRIELEFSEDRDGPFFLVLQKYLEGVGRRDYSARLRALIFFALHSQRLDVLQIGIGGSKSESPSRSKSNKPAKASLPGSLENNILDEIDRDDLPF